MHADGHAEEWFSRPLPPFLIDYAAADVVRIAALYDYFEKNGYLDTAVIEVLQSCSDIYHHTSPELTPEEMVDGNVFKRSGILPMNVFPPGFDVRSPSDPLSVSQCLTCDKCSLHLPPACFPFSLALSERNRCVAKGRFVGIDEEFERSGSCKVCTLHLERQLHQKGSRAADGEKMTKKDKRAIKNEHNAKQRLRKKAGGDSEKKRSN